MSEPIEIEIVTTVSLELCDDCETQAVVLDNPEAPAELRHQTIGWVSPNPGGWGFRAKKFKGFDVSAKILRRIADLMDELPA